MSVSSGQSITVEFVTSNPTTGAAVNADSLPTGTLVVNGTDNAATVTVTNVDTGRYKAAVTLPTISVGDRVELAVSATVSSVTGKAIIWRETKDAVQSFSTAALAQFFTTATGDTFSAAVSQSVVYEIRQGVTTGPGVVINDDTSGKTIDSQATGAVDPTALLALGDWRTFADLCSDDGTKLTLVQLRTNTNFIAILDQAMGLVEQACLQGKRYTATDLATMLASGTVGAAALLGIVYRIAVVLAFNRRPQIEMKQPWIMEWAVKDLELLSQGNSILPFREVAEAGAPSSRVETATDVENRQGTSYQMARLLGRRSNRNDPTRQ